MSCCAPANSPGSGAAATDVCKRVNYTLGMLMGVDDFIQDQLYASSRRRELAREVLGYGTVHGLAVVVEPDGDKGPRVRVTPGMAWLPSGTPVCVDGDQCANLNDWLVANGDAVDTGLTGSPASFSAYLVLSHLQCLTDQVPIPGEPCRSDDELMAPSRIADGFRLDLRAAPPAQREEDALRDFVEWLLGTELVATSPALDEAGFVAALRAAAQDWLMPSSPPTSPPWLPPADYLEGNLPAGVDEALFRTALRLWATELRPLWMARPDCSCNATPIPPLDDAVLLARLELALVPSADGWQVSDAVADPVLVDESRRPVLLTLRMVQELLLRWRDDRDGEPGNSVVAETSFGLPSSPGSSPEYARADHTHGSPTLPTLGGDISGTLDNMLIESLQGVQLAAPAPITEGQVLTFSAGQWQPRSLPATPPTPPIPNLAGDLGGAITGNRLTALQGVPLNAPNPAADQVLRFVNGSWIAVDLPAPGTPAGQFVGRAAEPFEIVAAGEVRIVATRGTATAQMRPNPGYGQLSVQGAALAPNAQDTLLIDFGARVANTRLLPNYIVKLTPVWVEGTRGGFRVYLMEQVRLSGANAITFQVRLVGDSQLVDGIFPLAFQLEVSRF